MMSGLAGGLRGYNPEGGFLENLLGGVSGSLGGTLQANQMQHEEERQSIRDQAAQRELESRISENEAQASAANALATRREQPLGTPSPTRYGALTGMSPDEFNTLLTRERDLAGVRRAPAKPPKQPGPAKISQSKQDKLSRELGALNNSDDPAELMKVSMDPSLEAETRQRAWAKYRRLQSATNPSQVR
jgi:hypothetical protein